MKQVYRFLNLHLSICYVEINPFSPAGFTCFVLVACNTTFCSIRGYYGNLLKSWGLHIILVITGVIT